MKDWIWYVLFAIILIALILSGGVARNTSSTTIGLGTAVVLFIIVLVTMFLIDKSNIDWVEGFHFRVTPYKQNCLLKKNSCAQCCKKGFHGMKINFDYAGDRERMCASCTPYEDKPEPTCGCASVGGGEEKEIVEGYCPSCEWKGNCSKCSEACNLKNQIATLTSTGIQTEEEGVKEGYCSKCDGVYSPSVYSPSFPEPPKVEGFCSSCSGGL